MQADPEARQVTRCRTSVTMVLASATRCHLSTAIRASDRAARIPDGNLAQSRPNVAPPNHERSGLVRRV